MTAFTAKRCKKYAVKFFFIAFLTRIDRQTSTRWRWKRVCPISDPAVEKCDSDMHAIEGRVHKGRPVFMNDPDSCLLGLKITAGIGLASIVTLNETGGVSNGYVRSVPYGNHVCAEKHAAFRLPPVEFAEKEVWETCVFGEFFKNILVAITLTLKQPN